MLCSSLKILCIKDKYILSKTRKILCIKDRYIPFDSKSTFIELNCIVGQRNESEHVYSFMCHSYGEICIFHIL